MNRRGFYKELGATLGITIEEAKVITDGFTNTIIGIVSNGNDLSIHGFGKFYVQKKRPGRYAHPITGKVIPMPEIVIARFTPGKIFKRKMRLKFPI